jgi:hypothetical protein
VSLLEERLAALGFGAAAQQDPGGWCVERIGPAADDHMDHGTTPLRRPDWSVWLDLLRDRPGPSFYHIRRAS